MGVRLGSLGSLKCSANSAKGVILMFHRPQDDLPGTCKKLRKRRIAGQI